MPAKLTIGMATYDDYDGVFFTIQSLRLHHPELRELAEFLIIDNNPAGPVSEGLKNLAKGLPGCRYIPFGDSQGTAPAKGRIFAEAATPWVMSVDSHVLFAPDAFRKTLEYMEANPESNDLLQGPLVYDGMQSASTHFEPGWGTGMFGKWSAATPVHLLPTEPFPIPMQGMGAFLCRKEAWLGFNPLFKGFGGEEWYIHEKYRKAGHQVLCLPYLQWVHRFGRPRGIPYVNSWEDRIWNYHVGFKELGLSTDEMDAHFKVHLGEAAYQRIKDNTLASMLEHQCF